MTVARPGPLTPLHEAKAWLRERVYDGERCPCCTQHVQAYRWSLYATAIRALALYYRLGDTTGFVHSSEIKALGHRGQGDAARLRLWGLVENDERRREDGGRSGNWRVTELGGAFLRGEASIRKYAKVYDGRCLGFEGEPVTVYDVAGVAFNFRELMAA